MDITRLLRGKRFAMATFNGTQLRLTMHDNTELDVAWVDENGRPVKGRPVVVNFGARLHAQGVRDLARSDLLRLPAHN